MRGVNSCPRSIGSTHAASSPSLHLLSRKVAHSLHGCCGIVMGDYCTSLAEAALRSRSALPPPSIDLAREDASATAFLLRAAAAPPLVARQQTPPYHALGVDGLTPRPPWLVDSNSPPKPCASHSFEYFDGLRNVRGVSVDFRRLTTVPRTTENAPDKLSTQPLRPLQLHRRDRGAMGRSIAQRTTL